MPPSAVRRFIKCKTHRRVRWYAICQHVMDGAPIAEHVLDERAGVLACAECKDDHAAFVRMARPACIRCAKPLIDRAPAPIPNVEPS